MIYLIVNKERDIAKIGRSNNPLSRLRNLKTSSAFDLELIDYIGNIDDKYERLFHHYYNEHKINREWFRLSSITENCLNVSKNKLLSSYFNFIYENNCNSFIYSQCQRYDINEYKLSKILNINKDEVSVIFNIETHNDKLLRKLDSNTSFTLKINDGVKRDTKLKILELVDKRVFNKITQSYMANTCNVSIPTIKRFENLEVDSLSLFMNYKFILEDLPNKKKIEVPKWVYS